MSRDIFVEPVVTEQVLARLGSTHWLSDFYWGVGAGVRLAELLGPPVIDSSNVQGIDLAEQLLRLLQQAQQEDIDLASAVLHVFAAKVATNTGR